MSSAAKGETKLTSLSLIDGDKCSMSRIMEEEAPCEERRKILRKERWVWLAIS